MAKEKDDTQVNERLPQGCYYGNLVETQGWKWLTKNAGLEMINHAGVDMR